MAGAAVYEPLCAQGFQGSLRGRVIDPNGAAVPATKITLIDEGTSLSRATLTTAVGEFAFASLTPATYSVIAEAPGFKRLERRGVVVSTQSAVTVDLALELGQVTEQVNVTEESPALETANASTGTVVDRQKLIDLPNLGRNPFMMSKLSEGVVQVGNPKFNRMQDQSGSSQISIAGGPVRGNNYTLDGISITDSTNRAVIIPSVEAVQEMKVQANTYDAEMGRTGGGTFNTFLRSGTNQVHGSAFGYMRETEWLANNYFSNAAGTPRIDQPFRNYGGSIGGPIRIPKIYDGRNRTFFWITGEAYRQTESAGTILAVPTERERNGDFSRSLSRLDFASGALQAIYDPLTTTTAGTRQVFAGNVLPASRIDAAGRAMASYYPLPNASARFYGDANYNATVSAYNRADQTTWKVDHELFRWWKASASYLHYGSREPGNAWFGGVASPNQGVLFRKVDATQVNSTLTPTPTTVVAVRYGFNRFPNFSAPTSSGFDLTRLNLPASLAPTNPAFPSISMGDLTSYGGGNTSWSVLHSKSFNATVSKFMGKHSLKAGFDWRSLNNDGIPGTGPSSFSFSDVFTRSRPTQTVQGTGASLATMLLGYPTGGSVTLSTKFFNFVRYYAGFVQDDWRVNSKLTLNFGLRWERETGPADMNDNFITGFNPDKASPLQQTVADPKIFGVVQYAGLNGNGRTAGNPNLNKWSPRVGFAYAPNSKTAIRGGYGIFWAPMPFSFQSTLGYSQSTPIIASIDNNFTPSASLSNPYPTGFLTPIGNADGERAGIGQGLTIPDRDARSGYVQQYSFDIQRQIGSFVLSGGYIGSKSSNLAQDGRNINQLAPQYLSLGSALNQSVANPMYQRGGTLAVGNPTISRSQLLRPHPQFTSVSLSNSDTNRAQYHALYMKVQRRFAQGMTVLSTYTWSQNMDQAYGATGNSFAGTVSGPQNAYAPEQEWGLSSSHTPHRLSLAATYELPFGKGKRFLSGSRWADLAVGGWSINAVSVMQSGYPLSITQPNDNSVIGANHMRPNATGLSPNVDAPFADRLGGWFNRAAFSQAPQFTFGNLSRTISLRGPGQINWDLSMFKTFAITERLKAQFRAEALNFTNTPMFYAPNTTFTNPQFGRITSQANFSRMVQLGVRFFL
jgi:hypothetical protein